MSILWIIVCVIVFFISYILFNMWRDSESRVAKYLCTLFFLKLKVAVKENGEINDDIHKGVLKSLVSVYLSTLGWDENR